MGTLQCFATPIIMNYRSLASILLTAGLVTCALAQDQWAKYKPRTLKQIVSIFAKASFRNPDFVMRDKGRVVMVLSANTFPSLVKVTYTGQSRVLSAKKREVIATWLKTYGPKNPDWQSRIVGWAAAFPHVARSSLRGERPTPEVAVLVGAQGAEELTAAADHMPSHVVLKMADLLREACEAMDMDRFAFLQLDHQRALLIDHIGACERIAKPLASRHASLWRWIQRLFAPYDTIATGR